MSLSQHVLWFDANKKPSRCKDFCLFLKRESQSIPFHAITWHLFTSSFLPFKMALWEISSLGMSRLAPLPTWEAIFTTHQRSHPNHHGRSQDILHQLCSHPKRTQILRRSSGWASAEHWANPGLENQCRGIKRVDWKGRKTITQLNPTKQLQLINPVF